MDLPTIQIMYQHTGVGDIIGMEISDFKVIGGLRLGKLFARNTFYFAKRAVGKKNFIAASLFHYNTGKGRCQGGGPVRETEKERRIFAHIREF